MVLDTCINIRVYQYVIKSPQKAINKIIKHLSDSSYLTTSYPSYVYKRIKVINDVNNGQVKALARIRDNMS